MKLTIFKTPDADHPQFGIVLKDQFVLSFTTIIQKAKLSVSLLESMEQYLAHLPESQDMLKDFSNMRMIILINSNRVKYFRFNRSKCSRQSPRYQLYWILDYPPGIY